MACAKEQCATPDPLLSPGAKSVLEGFSLGRGLLQAGGFARRLIRNLSDPVRQKVWMGRFLFSSRNVVLRGRPITIPLGEISIRLVPEGATARDSWAGIRHDGHEVSLILSMLEPGMTFLDVGASEGLFTIAAATKVGTAGVFAFEPSPSAYGILNRNLQLNGLSGIHVAQVALGEPTSGSIFQDNARCGEGAGTSGSVRRTTIDDFLGERKIPNVGVMRSNIGGAELILFRGARHLLRRTDAPTLFLEAVQSRTRRFGYHPVEILWLLGSCGYSLFTLNSETGAISELRPDYQYNSMVIAAKPGHPSFTRLQARMQ